MKKVLFITPGKLPIPPVKGGAVENLTQILLSDEKIIEENEIEVISIYDEEACELSKNDNKIKYTYIDCSDKLYKIFRIIRYLINRIPNVYVGNEFIYRVYKYLKKNKKHYDYIIVENPVEYALLIKHKFSDKLVLHLHNDFLNNKIKFCKQIYDEYDSILCISKFIMQRVSTIYGEQSSKIKLVYNGVDMNNFRIVKEETEFKKEIRKKYKIKKNDFVYIYSGRITQEKGVLEMVKAFVKANEKQENIKLIVCGGISNVPKKNIGYIKKVIKESNNNVIFTDYINYSELPNYYSISNVGIIPSVWEEPFALTVIENMACGNPIIISKSGGMTELVNNNVGIVIDLDENYIDNLANAIVEIKNKTYETEIMREHALRFKKDTYVEKFNNQIGW